MRIMLPCLLLAAAAVLPAAKNLEVYFIDVEGGQATLFVAPSGDSLLVDAGWGGFNGRDAGRIAAAAKAAGVKKIDYLVVTHYHEDHVGGAGELAAKLPILHFADHGPTVETSREALPLFKAYEDVRAKGEHIVAKPGDAIPVKDVQVHVLAAAGAAIGSPIATDGTGAGRPNPACSSYRPLEADTSENAQSVGLLISFGDFRLVDLGDLTWNKESALACPNNLIGAVDVLVVSHHGLNSSNSPQLLAALRPRVAVVDNGARKGGSAEAWQIVHDSPRLEDIWQLHYAVGAPKDRNASNPFIANLDEICQGSWLRLTAQRDGSFTLYNSRNKYEKT